MHKNKIKQLKGIFLLVTVAFLSGCQSLAVVEEQDRFINSMRASSGMPLPVDRAAPIVPANSFASPQAAGSATQADDHDVDYLIPPPRQSQVSGAAKSAEGLVANIALARLTANIAVEVDYDLYVLLGSSESAARTYVANLFEAVSNVYRRDANIEIKPTFVRVWTTPADPWSSSTTSGALGELRNYWNTYETTRSRAAVVLLSSRGLGGGIAYLDAVCQKAGAYDTAVMGNLTGQINNTPGSNTWDVIVTAHELGHTFGTGHSHCTLNSAGTGYYDQCYGTERYTPPSGCYQGAYVPSYGTIMSYCHTNGTPEVGLRNINPLSFINSTNDPKIKNIIRTNAEKYTVGNDAEACLVPSWPIEPSFMAPIIHILTE